MASISRYHSHNVTFNSYGELLKLVNCDFAAILVMQTIQIRYVLDVISLSYTLIKNVLLMHNW
jgi:hypothetical protein